jgi:hypothetical protein
MKKSTNKTVPSPAPATPAAPAAKPTKAVKAAPKKKASAAEPIVQPSAPAPAPKPTPPPPAPAPAPVAKIVQPTPAPVAKPLAPKPAPAAAKPVAPPPVKTTITAQIDIGYGHTLHLRGEGPGLSWDQGVLMECVADDKWTLVLGETARPIVFKFLVDDLSWSADPNYTIEPGADVTLVPTF